jgi:hypothetical protein
MIHYRELRFTRDCISLENKSRGVSQKLRDWSQLKSVKKMEVWIGVRSLQGSHPFQVVQTTVKSFTKGEFVCEKSEKFIFVK